MSKRRREWRRMGGFTLIEVLISVVIFSVGLLGLAGLQATGLRLNQSAMLRSQAVQFSYDMLDAMRANRNALASYVIAMDDDPPTSPGNQVERDLQYWLNDLGSALPAGDGSITLSGNRVTITVQWDDSRGAEAAKTFTLVSDL